jgi:Protein of unknown function (DUF998)
MNTSPADVPDLTGSQEISAMRTGAAAPRPSPAGHNASGHYASGRDRRMPASWPLRAGVMAPAVFYTVMIVLGQVTPGYNAISRFGSELSLGRLGPIMIANFIILGLCEIAFAVKLRQLIGTQPSGRLGAAAVGLAGVAFLVAGVFVTDPQGTVPPTVHGILHVVAALMLFPLAIPVAGLAVARRFRRQHGFARYSAITAIASPLLFVATFMSGGLLGLMERILIGVDLFWLTLLAAQASRLPGAATTAGRPFSGRWRG